jgi:type VI secretion system protein ImpI
MPLRLQVISAHRESMGGGYIQEFAACGGTIGRSLQCDWPLPDSKRFISSQHAMIDYQGGAYYLVDLSRNGLFVNGSKKAVGKGNPQRLFDGDIIRLGEFEISVTLIHDPNEADEDGMRNSIVRAQMVSEDESVELAMLPADQIRDESVLERALRPGNASGQVSALSEISTANNKHLQIAAAERVLADTTVAFLKAAGLDPKDFIGMDALMLLQNAGRLLAEFTECTHSLLVAKDAILAEFSIRSQNARSPANPLRSSDGMTNALRLLLGKKNAVNTAGTDAIDSAFNELDQHQHAVMNAMRNALGDYLENFEPKVLEQFFAQQTQRVGVGQKAFREQYAEAFAGLAQPNKHKRPQRFDEEFSRAYEMETGD